MLLSSSWLKQQATKGLTGVTACFSASYGLRQRMLHFLQNLEYYMMFEVLEPNWHVLLTLSLALALTQTLTRCSSPTGTCCCRSSAPRASSTSSSRSTMASSTSASRCVRQLTD